MTVSLAASIDRLYEAFASIPRPQELDYCSHCHGPETVALLLQDVALRELPVEVLDGYAADCLLTIGSAEDFRYYLPRLLEVAVTDSWGYPSLEALGSRLPGADWQSWPDGQRQGVRDVFDALWEKTLRAHPHEPTAGDVLCAVANTGDRVDRHLSRWGTAVASGVPSAVGHLYDFLVGDVERVDGQWTPTHAYWITDPKPVHAWLAGPLPREVLSGAATTQSAQVADLLAEITELLRE